jgi:hypothetical protein
VRQTGSGGTNSILTVDFEIAAMAADREAFWKDFRGLGPVVLVRAACPTQSCSSSTEFSFAERLPPGGCANTANPPNMNVVANAEIPEPGK